VQWANEQMITFWCIQICITTLVRRALEEVCTVPVLLVVHADKLHVHYASVACNILNRV